LGITLNITWYADLPPPKKIVYSASVLNTEMLLPYYAFAGLWYMAIKIVKQAG